MNRPSAIATPQMSNERVIVTEWRFDPGAQTGWHVHKHDYVVVPQTDGDLLLEALGGNRISRLIAGRSYAGSKATNHNVINNSDHVVVFIEIAIR
ncbi:cupin domain-containing protein [Paraburkholderia hiiakae]|uniref:cupin n=1 Tax=Paraburkholderia hiiakae TaxID=1081782 RepID=UPI0019198CA6|nr:cupin [Paraburkholderia hiiakae]